MIGIGEADALTFPPVLICLLGGFRLLKNGQSVHLKPGGKLEALFVQIAFRAGFGVPREELLSMLWPASDPSLAGQSLNGLVCSAHRSLGDALSGRSPILHGDGSYRLNTGAGVTVDVQAFDAASDAGDRLARAGDNDRAVDSYREAVELYVGDLIVVSEVGQVVERERLRVRYLSLLARIADHHFTSGNYAAALRCALQLLTKDPCREDAHRMAMRCYVRSGQRAQALRQYRVCESILAAEFEARTEPATRELFDLVRLDPVRV